MSDPVEPQLSMVIELRFTDDGWWRFSARSGGFEACGSRRTYREAARDAYEYLRGRIPPVAEVKEASR